MAEKITWEVCLRDAKQMIQAHSLEIKRLEKSVAFFEKQINTGESFPIPFAAESALSVDDKVSKEAAK